MNHKSYRRRRRPGEIPRVARRPWLASLAPAVLAIAVLAVACGGSSSGDGEGVASAGGGEKANDSSAKKDPHQAGLDFAKCMREHGIDMPDPKAGEGGMIMIGPGPGEGGDEPTSGQRPPAGFEEAHEACKHHLDDLVQDGAAEPDPEEQDRALKFAQCMREHGVDMPDPDFSRGGGFSVDLGEGGLDPTSETFKEAQKACGGLFGPGSGAPGVGIAGGARS